MIDEPRRGVIGELSDEEYLLSARTVLKIIWKRRLFVVLATVAIVVLALGYSFQQTPQYQTSALILVGQKSDLMPSPENAVGLQDVATTVSMAADSRPVAEGAIQKLGLHMTPEALLANLDAEVVEGTQFVRLTYTNSDPETARRVTNAVGNVLSKRISEAGTGTSAIAATLWDGAVTPADPVSPQPLRTALLALIMGAVLGVGLAFLLEYFDDSWRSPEEVEQILGLPNFGAIPSFDTSINSNKRARAEIGSG